MLVSKDEDYDSKPIYTIYTNESPKTIAYSIIQRSTAFSSMKRSVRPLFSVLLLIVFAATFGCRVAVKNGFGSIYGDGDVGIKFTHGSEIDPPVDFPLFNSTLLKLAEVEVGEGKMKKEIEQLLEGNFGNSARFRSSATWRRFFSSGDIRARTSRGMSVNVRSPEFSRVWREFRKSLRDWDRKKRFRVDVIEELLDQVKVPIDRHNGVVDVDGPTRRYSSCAVVGNSGILLSKEYGELIDSHEAVIRLNNARIQSYQRNVGSKTTISFVNSNILHLCARRGDCFCHPYGANVPIVMYMCQPSQFLDYVVCNSSHKSPLIVTNPSFDVLCSRIVKYYSLKRFAAGLNVTLAHWNSAHDGSMFHYSSGMQAVTMALGICDQVSLFGFGKLTSTKHHYHTNQKQELSLHDYQAEYDFYDDLLKKPHAIPFFPEKFKFPPMVIHR